MNEVARATYAAALKIDPQFEQIPGKVAGGAAPADCLAGKNCIGDTRMAALAQENEQLGQDASAVRAILAEEKAAAAARGKPYAAEDEKAARERIGRSIASMAGSSEPKIQEAYRLFKAGKVAEGRAKQDEALDDDDKAAADLERVYGLFPRLMERRNQTAGTLSGGEQQMLAIGRALMANPKVILLDEPSMGLAPVIVDEVFTIINKLKETGITLSFFRSEAIFGGFAKHWHLGLGLTIIASVALLPRGLVGLPGQWRERLVGKMTGARSAASHAEVRNESV